MSGMIEYADLAWVVLFVAAVASPVWIPLTWSAYIVGRRQFTIRALLVLTQVTEL
jgi:hypothetical protein